MTGNPLWRTRPSTSRTSGIALIVVAIAAITVSRAFDGFVQGLLGGAGVMLALIAVAALSPLLRRQAASADPVHAEDETSGRDASCRDDRSGWLPSRDSRS
ncbi:MAG TPA: hypothetical protein VEX57_19735 [Microlunatus sp.]|nr:hypothetical protein [Microlunatus sp.]